MLATSPSIHRIGVLLAGILFCLAACDLARAQSADEGMLQADRALVQALAKSDKAALAKLLDGELTWTDFQGKSRNRMQVLEGSPQPIVSNEKGAERKQFTYGELGDVQVNLGRAHALHVWAKRADGWKLIVYQEVKSLEAAPTFAPGAGKDCENPCKGIPFQPLTETDRQVATAYSKLETAAMAKNSAVFSTMVANEFVAASSNSNKIVGKRERMDDFDHSKNAGVAPTPFKTGRMFDFGDAVLMTSDHVPDRGKPLRVTRVWVRRNGGWVETLSYQTSVQ
jgi:hypothetical protein